MRSGYFPIVDYFNAFDFIISGAATIPLGDLHFDKMRSSSRCRERSRTVVAGARMPEYYFDVNGADQLEELIIGCNNHDPRSAQILFNRKNAEPSALATRERSSRHTKS